MCKQANSSATQQCNPAGSAIAIKQASKQARHIVCTVQGTLLPGASVSVSCAQVLCSIALQLVRPSCSFSTSRRLLGLLLA